MSTLNRNAKPFVIGGNSSSAKGKTVSPDVSKYTPAVEQLSHDMAATNIDSSEDGGWEVQGKKNRNRAGNNAPKQWGTQSSAPKAWGEANVVAGGGYNGGWKKPVGRGNTKAYLPDAGFEKPYLGPTPVITPPLQNGWQWPGKTGGSSQLVVSAPVDHDDIPDHIEEDDDSDEFLDDSDDDLVSDEYDSDASAKSHETRKKSHLFNKFFVALDKLTLPEINDSSRQWHCPACQNGPGAIDWFTGLQALMVHAKTRKAKKVKQHREFATLLDEELRQLGTSVIPSGEAFGKWKGLKETVNDREIVWPPMVMIMNTQLEKDVNDKWLGMGNQELVEYFITYEAQKARHSYGPQGHRGISVLIFDGTAMGYLEAERLHKHFIEQKTDRDAWEHRRTLFYPGGARQLYGYLATKSDMTLFNQHCPGKTKLKFEMRSYLERVDGPMKKMSEDNQKLNYLQTKVEKEKKHSKAFQESFGIMTEKLRKTMQENRIVRERTLTEHEQIREQMSDQVAFFEIQFADIQDFLAKKEAEMEDRLQEERNKFKQLVEQSKSKEELEMRKMETSKFITSQNLGIEVFETRREKLIAEHESKMAKRKKKFLEDNIEQEKLFKDMMTSLMEEYTPTQ